MKNIHNKNTGSNIERSDLRIDATGEVFTPLKLCSNCVNRIPEGELKNPNSTFLDLSSLMISTTLEFLKSGQFSLNERPIINIFELSILVGEW